MQKTLHWHHTRACGKGSVWRGCALVSGHAPNFNTRSIQPQKTAIAAQAYERVRGNTPVQPAAEIGREFPDGMNPTHHAAGSAQVNSCFSQDRPIGVLVSTKELPARIDVFRKRTAGGHDK